jgi:hypothetical protein
MNAVFTRWLAALTVAATAAVLVGPAPTAVAGGLLLAFALPGLALTAILFRGRDLSAVERVLLAPALSMALLVISGLVMYAAGVDLDRSAWTAATAGVTLVALLGATLPDRKRAGAEPGDHESLTADDESAADVAAGVAARVALGASAGLLERASHSPPAPAAALTLVRPAAGHPTDAADTAELPKTPVPAADDADTVELSTTPGPAAAADTVEPPATTDPGADAADTPELPRTPGPAAGRPAATSAAGWTRRMLRQVLPLAVALAVLAAAGWTSYASSRDSYDVTVTTLSAERPARMGPSGLRTVRVTATGLVGAGAPYRLVVAGHDGRATEERPVVADRHGRWTATLIIPGRQRVIANLFRADSDQPYRTLLFAPDPG